MKEVKSPKRPLIFYYGIVLVVLLVFNLFITPMLAERQVKEVDYGTFMKMTEDKDIGQVQIDSTQITFTDKAESAIYKTGLMPDDDLTQRLYDSGAKFSKEIETRTSPFMSFLMSVVLPLLLFWILGRFLARKMMEQAMTVMATSIMSITDLRSQADMATTAPICTLGHKPLVTDPGIKEQSPICLSRHRLPAMRASM